MSKRIQAGDKVRFVSSAYPRLTGMPATVLRSTEVDGVLFVKFDDPKASPPRTFAYHDELEVIES